MATMTRFEQAISGQLGDFWEKSAKKELHSLRRDLQSGKITIDPNGVARNSIGRVVMSDLLEKLLYITDDIDVDATRAARDAEVSASIAEYKKNYTGPSEEDLLEMKAAFGTGTTVVDAITGAKIVV